MTFSEIKIGAFFWYNNMLFKKVDDTTAHNVRFGNLTILAHEPVGYINMEDEDGE